MLNLCCTLQTYVTVIHSDKLLILQKKLIVTESQIRNIKNETICHIINCISSRFVITLVLSMVNSSNRLEQWVGEQTAHVEKDYFIRGWADKPRQKHHGLLLVYMQPKRSQDHRFNKVEEIPYFFPKISTKVAVTT